MLRGIDRQQKSRDEICDAVVLGRDTWLGGDRDDPVPRIAGLNFHYGTD